MCRLTPKHCKKPEQKQNGSVCLTFDRVRCACVASNLRVDLWLEWPGLGTLGRGRKPTNKTRSLCFKVGFGLPAPNLIFSHLAGLPGEARLEITDMRSRLHQGPIRYLDVAGTTGRREGSMRGHMVVLGGRSFSTGEKQRIGKSKESAMKQTS